MTRKLEYGDNRTPVVREAVQRPLGEILALRKSKKGNCQESR